MEISVESTRRMKTIPLDRMRLALSYNPETGEFLRLVKRGRHRAGTLAGGVDRLGYPTIYFDGIKYLAHRVAWAFQTGSDAPSEIDHINNIKADIRFANLRLSTRSANTQNRHKANRTNKTTGILGVTQRGNQKPVAQITVGEKNVRLGSFETVELAHQAYLVAKRKLHEGCTI